MAPPAAAKLHHDAAGGDRVLDDLLARGRAFSCEFPILLANHLPMVLVALRRMGAGDERLVSYFETYRTRNGLIPPPPAVAPIEREHWDAHLGDRTRESDYRAFFAGEVRRLGPRGACAAYLPALIPGLAASALHALMRLAYAAMTESADEAGVALGYWAATYMPLCPATGAAPVTDDPAEVLARLRGGKNFAQVEVERDLLWHFIRAMTEKPDFKPVVDWLRIGPETHDRVAKASLALMAGTMDFCAVHAVTGTHWIRLMQPVLPDPALALRYFWQAIAALYPKIGFTDLPAAEQLEAWRHAPCPDWPDILAAAVRSNDEHDHSYTFSSYQEWEHYGDPLYRFVAARRLALIP